MSSTLLNFEVQGTAVSAAGAGGFSPWWDWNLTPAHRAGSSLPADPHDHRAPISIRLTVRHLIWANAKSHSACFCWPLACPTLEKCLFQFLCPFLIGLFKIISLFILLLSCRHSFVDEHLITAVPNLFGTRDWFHGRRFFHRPGRAGWFGDDSSSLFSSSPPAVQPSS